MSTNHRNDIQIFPAHNIRKFQGQKKMYKTPKVTHLELNAKIMTLKTNNLTVNTSKQTKNKQKTQTNRRKKPIKQLGPNVSKCHLRINLKY